LDDKLALALQAAGSGSVQVERMVSNNLELIQQHLRQWIATTRPEPGLVVLPSTHWLGLGLLRPALAIPPDALAPVGGLCIEPALLGVHAASPAYSAAELPRLVRARPHQLPAAVHGWNSPGHWLAMLWTQATGAALRWQFSSSISDLSLRIRTGRAAIVFGGRVVFDHQHPALLAPLAAWSDTRPLRLQPIGTVDPFHDVGPPALPPPCFVTALVPKAWANANMEGFHRLQSWLQAAAATAPWQAALAQQGLPDWAVSASVVRAAANAQHHAMASAVALKLEGGRS